MTTAPCQVTVIALQQAETLQEKVLNDEVTVGWVQTGEKSISEMLSIEESHHAFIVWAARVLGCVMMIAGFRMMFNPLSAVQDALGGSGDSAATWKALWFGAWATLITVG